MTENWQSNKSLAVTNLHMLQNDIMCDVTFLAGESRREVKAHKYMLVSRSPVFYAMLCGPMAESRDTIELPDVEVDSFKMFLRFLYTEECTITADMVMYLLYAARKYEVESLVDRCTSYLSSEISVDNVCTILQHAHMFSEQGLVSQCLSFVLKNGNKVLESDGFLSLSKDTLRMIVECDNLEAKEENVYTACVKWADENCKHRGVDVDDVNIREALGDVIFSIRFPCMALDTFTSRVSVRGILSAEEKVNVFQKIVQTEGIDSLFNCEIRIPEKSQCFITRFKQQPSNGWGIVGTNAIAFKCTANASLTGLSLFKPCEPGKVNYKINVWESSAWLLSHDVRLEYEENTPFVESMFDSPLQLNKDVVYTLSQTVKGVKTFYGTSGESCIKTHYLEVCFSDSYRSSDWYTNVNMGKFHGLYFDVVPK